MIGFLNISNIINQNHINVQPLRNMVGVLARNVRYGDEDMTRRNKGRKRRPLKWEEDEKFEKWREDLERLRREYANDKRRKEGKQKETE